MIRLDLTSLEAMQTRQDEFDVSFLCSNFDTVLTACCSMDGNNC